MIRVNLLRTCIPHLFEDIGMTEQTECFLSICESLALLMQGTCDYVPDDEMSSAENRSRLRQLQKKHIKVLALAELTLPETEYAIYLHETIHMCDAIRRWNNPRNFWCFITERFVGFCKGFVKNRSLACENLV
jgi:hypothetical protein